MIKLKTLIKNIPGRYIYLEWENAPVDAVEYNVYSSRNEVISNDWTLCGTTANVFFNDYVNFDDSILNSRITYRVDAINSTEDVLDSVIFNSDSQSNELLKRTLNVLTRDAEIALRNNQWSKEAFVMKPLKSGTRCYCYSRDLKASAKPNCSICYGKGYEGGFYDPMHSFVIVLEEQVKRRTVNEKKPTSYNVVTAVMPSFPQVYEDDYVYVKGVGIFFVIRSTTRSLLGAQSPTSLVTMSLLKPDSVMYTYPLQDQVTTVTGMVQDTEEPSVFVITGTNLIPYFGEFKIILSNNSNMAQYGVYWFPSVEEITDTTIKIRTDLTETISNYSYRLRLNGIAFTGTIL